MNELFEDDQNMNIIENNNHINNNIIKSGNNILSLEQIIFKPNSKLVAGNNYTNENNKINFNFGKHKLETATAALIPNRVLLQPKVANTTM